MDLRHFNSNIYTSPYRADDDTGSYQLAVSPEVPDDGLTVDGKPRAMRMTSPQRQHQTTANQLAYSADDYQKESLKNAGAKSSRKMRKNQNNIEDLKKELVCNFHKIPLAQLIDQLQTDPINGLTQEQAHEIWLRDGPNQLTEVKGVSKWVKFCKNIFGGFATLLWWAHFCAFLPTQSNFRHPNLHHPTTCTWALCLWL